MINPSDIDLDITPDHVDIDDERKLRIVCKYNHLLITDTIFTIRLYNLPSKQIIITKFQDHVYMHGLQALKNYS